MEPLSAALLQRLPVESSDAPGVTLIPCGLLALLPLHAAWTEDPSAPTRRRYFIDEFTVNYAPWALALGHARGAAQRSPASRLLAVEEPLAARASSLPSVHAEVAAIAGLFDSPVILAHVEATRRAVLAALPQAQVVHFSCHGGNNWQSPLESGLLMADDENGKDVLLSVRDFLESSETGGRLATLSACETGIIGTDLPDEVVALPSALLQAGFGGVAASLWSVADISTASPGITRRPTVAAQHHQPREGRVFQTLQSGAIRHARARRRGRRFFCTGHEPGSGEPRLSPPLLVGRFLSDRRLASRLRADSRQE
jgi:hypothetical protein